MDGKTMVVVIIAICVLGGGLIEILQRWLKLKQKQPDPAFEEKIKQQQNEITELKQRIAVLEQIVTDDGYALSKQIESLNK